MFGPGIGECIVAHLGHGDWIVVDSCLNRQTREPIALEYLKSLNVDVRSRVKLVVATHWHDDHIKGISKVLRAAENARFVDSAAYDAIQLARVVELGSKTGGNASVTEEYAAIYQILKERRKRGEQRDAVGPVHALANRKLLSLAGADRIVKSDVTALSPSDGTYNRARTELIQALSTIRARRRPARQGPNQLCVVLWLKVGVIQAMLGADLEHVPGATEGWKAIIDSDERPDGRSGIFKVPHHGSKNADCPECWDSLLANQTVAVVTPYAPSKLPGKLDIDRLCGKTQQVFLTGDHTLYKVPRLNPAVEKTLREGNNKRRALEGKMGHVRLRADAQDANKKPDIELFDGAEKRCA